MQHSANERTFLAWVRTSMGVVGLGLVTARLGDAVAPLWSELTLLGAGVLMVLLAYVRMLQVKARIDSEALLGDKARSANFLLVLLIVSLFGLIAAFAVHIR